MEAERGHLRRARLCAELGPDTRHRPPPLLESEQPPRPPDGDTGLWRQTTCLRSPTRSKCESQTRTEAPQTAQRGLFIGDSAPEFNPNQLRDRQRRPTRHRAWASVVPRRQRGRREPPCDSWGRPSRSLLMPYLLEVSNLGAWEVRVTSGPCRGRGGVRAALCASLHALCSRTPHMSSQQHAGSTHTRANTPSSFCGDGHMGGSWITSSLLWGLKGEGTAGPACVALLRASRERSSRSTLTLFQDETRERCSQMGRDLRPGSLLSYVGPRQFIHFPLDASGSPPT